MEFQDSSAWMANSQPRPRDVSIRREQCWLNLTVTLAITLNGANHGEYNAEKFKSLYDYYITLCSCEQYVPCRIKKPLPRQRLRTRWSGRRGSNPRQPGRGSASQNPTLHRPAPQPTCGSSSRPLPGASSTANYTPFRGVLQAVAILISPPLRRRTTCGIACGGRPDD